MVTDIMVCTILKFQLQLIKLEHIVNKWFSTKRLYILSVVVATSNKS